MDKAQIDRLTARLAKLDPKARKNLLENLRKVIPPPRLSKYCPKDRSEKQEAFLSAPNLEVLYGGAAGGGKTASLLIAGLQYCDQPNYDALLLRRTLKELELPNSLISLSKRWLSGTDAVWKAQKNKYEFPSGATLTFNYLDRDDDKWQYQSSSFNFIAFDESAEFPQESTYTFLFSRLRRARGVTIPPRMRLAANPIGPGAAWLKRRFITNPGANNLSDEPCFICDHRHWDEACVQPKCSCILNPNSIPRLYVPARLEDNPFIDKPSYRLSLAQLDPYTRQALENGDWDAKPPGKMFRREWFRVVAHRPADVLCRVRFWDLAATQEDRKKNPSWTCGVRMSYSENGAFCIEDVRRVRETPGNVKALVKQTASIDGLDTEIHIEQEPGSSGIAVIADYIKYLPQYVVKAYKITGSKEDRAAPYASQAEAGNVSMAQGDWNETYLQEMEQFPSSTVKNDQVDASAGAYIVLAERTAGVGDWWVAGERRSHDW